MEEDVHIDMPPTLTYELIAADHPDVQIDKNKVLLSRLVPNSQVSMILLAEGPIEAESFSPSLSSKATKGKIFKKLEDVPPNAGTVVLALGGFVLVVFLCVFVPTKIFEYQKRQEEKAQQSLLAKYAYLDKSGWRGIDGYIKSDARNSYGGFEFPLVLTGARRTGSIYELSFVATNKTSSLLKVTSYFEAKTKDKPLYSPGEKSVFDLQVNPMASLPVVVSAKLDPDAPLADLFVKISLKFGDDYVWGIRFYPTENDTANRALLPAATPSARRG